jgi:hypothetical protein
LNRNNNNADKLLDSGTIGASLTNDMIQKVKTSYIEGGSHGGEMFRKLQERAEVAKARQQQQQKQFSSAPRINAYGMIPPAESLSIEEQAHNNNNKRNYHHHHHGSSLHNMHHTLR